MSYFNNFNFLYYNLENDTYSSRLVTNIFQRSTFLKEVLTNSMIAYDYYVKDSDTPESIAHKLYGSAHRHWIVLLYNKIMNPFYSFPMSDNKLHKYIENKYGYSLAVSMNTLHHYEKRVKKDHYEYNTLRYTNTETYTVSEYDVNPDTGEITLRSSLPTSSYFPITLFDECFDETFDNNTQTIGTVTLNFVSVYEYENNLNESRKTIKLLDASYVKQVEDEMRAIMKSE